MPKASPAYLLGGTSFLSTFIVTILDGVCYAFSKASAPDTSTIEAVIVSLTTISCVVLAALILIWVNDLKIDARVRRKGWRKCAYGTAIGYLSIATGITAGGIAWSAVQSMSGTNKSSVSPSIQSILITRCVLWAISVLSQGTLSGYLLTTLSRKPNHGQWPRLISHELDAISPAPSGTIGKEASKSPSLATESQRQSIDVKTSGDRLPKGHPSVSRTASQSSNRYSGRTLFRQDSSSKSNSLDLSPSLVAYPESVTTRSRSEAYNDDQGSDSGVGDSLNNRTQQLQRSNSEIKRSLDSVMLRPSSLLSSPMSSSTQLDVIKRPLPKLKLPDESNIHPLFRSDSRSPPPTPTPGTIVIAAPAAGQTISVKALNRMRSTRSIGAHTPRSRSPLFERTDQDQSDDEIQPHKSNDLVLNEGALISGSSLISHGS